MPQHFQFQTAVRDLFIIVPLLYSIVGALVIYWLLLCLFLIPNDVDIWWFSLLIDPFFIIFSFVKVLPGKVTGYCILLNEVVDNHAEIYYAAFLKQYFVVVNLQFYPRMMDLTHVLNVKLVVVINWNHQLSS